MLAFVWVEILLDKNRLTLRKWVQEKVELRPVSYTKQFSVNLGQAKGKAKCLKQLIMHGYTLNMIDNVISVDL